MANYSKRALLANTFGTLGYISCLFQWLFVALLYLPLLLDNEQIKHFLLPEEVKETAPIVTAGPPSPLLIGFAIIFTIFMLVLTVLLLVRAPLSIARTGKKATTKTASAIVPLVIHHPLSPAKKRRITSQLVKAIKLTVILLAFVLGFLSLLTPTTLPFDIIMFGSATLAIGSLVWFSAQYLSARALKVPLDKLV